MGGQKMKKLKFKFVILVSVLCIVCLSVSMGISYYTSYNIVVQESKEKTIMSAHSYSEKINGWLLAKGEILDEMANDIEYFGNFEKEHLESYFMNKVSPEEGIQTLYAGFNDRRFINGDGWIPPQEWDCTGRPWYVSAVEKDGVIYTDPYVDANTGEMIISIAKPIKQNGNIVGVAGMDIFVTVLTDIVTNANISSVDTDISESYAFLLDNNNNFVVHKNEEFKPNKDMGLKNINDVNSGEFKELGKKIEQKKLNVEQMEDYDGVKKYFISTPVEANGWTFGFVIPLNEFKSPLSRLLYGFGIAVVVSLLLTIIYTAFRINGFINPILNIKKHTQLVANGDLTQKVEIKSQDEIGELGNSFNNMMDDIKSIVSGIYKTYKSAKDMSSNVIDNTSNVQRISGEISGATEQIATEAMELKGNINDTKEFLESFSTKIESISKRVNEINGNSDYAIKSVEKGLVKLNELHAIETEVGKQSERTYSIIDAFNKSAAGINSMTEVISNIAEQTNMLALNAAIEAARAGEMGKGFAVVADQVRKLADESSSAAREIETQVAGVKSEVENFEEVKITSIELDNKKKEINRDITVDFNSIEKNIKDIVNNIKNVYEQMTDIGAEKEEMNEIMKNISEISENSAAATEEVCAATENQENLLNQAVNDIRELINKIDELSHTVEKFKI